MAPWDGDRPDRRFRGQRKEVVGTGDLVEACEDRRSTAIAMLPGLNARLPSVISAPWIVPTEDRA